MSETVKTLCFVVVAAVLAGVAALVTIVQTSAWATATRPDAEIGQLLFPDFVDYSAVKAMQITAFDEKTASIEKFRVAEVDGRWSLPSHENYPADANRQLADASAALLDLKKLGVVSDDSTQHALFGLLDPDKADAGSEGVGKRVQLEDASGSKLVDFIVGKAVPQRSGLRYVRKPQQDRVYEVQLDTSKLTTRFQDWIEPDLLKLNAFDIRRIAVRDYSVDLLRQPQFIDRGNFAVRYNNSPPAGGSQWELEQMIAVERNQPREVTLADDEELDTQKLNEMRNALDDLRIVAVSRKPTGLGDNLRAGEELIKNQEAVLSLQGRGFYLAQVDREANRYELVSNEGDIRVGMNNGVQYVLRFGQITSRGSDKQEADEEAAEPAASEGSNRYIFVAVEFNEDLIPKPELSLPQAKDPFAQPPAEGQSANSQDADAEPAADAAANEKDELPDEERKRLEAEDQHKLDEYNDKVKEGKAKVDELNDRFADWYYVISDDTYRKIHLHGSDIIRKKPAERTDDELPGQAFPTDEPLDPIRQFEQLRQGIDR